MKKKEQEQVVEPMAPTASVTPDTAFKAFRKTILEAAKAADACADQYRRASQAKEGTALLEVITDNFLWCVSHQVITSEILTSYYSSEELWAAGVYTSGNHDARGKARIFVMGNATVKAGGNATVEAGDNATVKAWGNATVEAGGNATVEAGDNATVEAGDNSHMLFYNDISRHSLSGKATAKDYYSNKLYFKKSAFEVIELDGADLREKQQPA
jgi:hypothetical protein